jgi:F0F1-type ATP synthase delta subunit
VIDCELLSKKVLTQLQMRELKAKIEADLGKKVTLEAVWRVRF